MRNLVLTSIALLGLVFTANAQTEKAQSGAEIVFESEVHDYGTIDFACDCTYAFKFTNTGKEPLVITDAKGSCGCTVPKWPKEPVMKGQSNYINVSYDTKRPGPKICLATRLPCRSHYS